MNCYRCKKSIRVWQRKDKRIDFKGVVSISHRKCRPKDYGIGWGIVCKLSEDKRRRESAAYYKLSLQKHKEWLQSKEGLEYEKRYYGYNAVVEIKED